MFPFPRASHLGYLFVDPQPGSFKPWPLLRGMVPSLKRFSPPFEPSASCTSVSPSSHVWSKCVHGPIERQMRSELSTARGRSPMIGELAVVLSEPDPLQSEEA